MVAGAQVGTAASEDAALQQSGVTARHAALRIGSASAASLTSLKYFIQSIQICQDVVMMGSGYSNTKGCINLYENTSADRPDYDQYLVTEAQEDTAPDRFIDLMTAEGQAALRHPVTLEIPAPSSEKESADGGPPSQTGAYRFGLINFYRPIKVTAQFPIVGEPDQYFRTRTVTQITGGRTMDGRFNTERVQIGDTLSGPTKETTYLLNNGGALFTFQKPFVITQADVDAQAEIKVDLVFNPEKFGQAYQAGATTAPRLSIASSAEPSVPRWAPLWSGPTPSSATPWFRRTENVPGDRRRSLVFGGGNRGRFRLAGQDVFHLVHG